METIFKKRCKNQSQYLETISLYAVHQTEENIAIVRATGDIWLLGAY